MFVCSKRSGGTDSVTGAPPVSGFTDRSSLSSVAGVHVPHCSLWSHTLLRTKRTWAAPHRRRSITATSWPIWMDAARLAAGGSTHPTGQCCSVKLCSCAVGGNQLASERMTWLSFYINERVTSLSDLSQWSQCAGFAQPSRWVWCGWVCQSGRAALLVLWHTSRAWQSQPLRASSASVSCITGLFLALFKLLVFLQMLWFGCLR